MDDEGEREITKVMVVEGRGGTCHILEDDIGAGCGTDDKVFESQFK